MRKYIRRLALATFVGLAAQASTAAAQQNFLPGFAGLRDGSQAPPGFYAGLMYWNTSASQYARANGTTLNLDPGITQQLGGVLLNYVTPVKIFGANWGVTAVLPFSTARMEFDFVNVDDAVSWGYTSTYLQPLSLGWHKKRADYQVGYALYFPTGSYSFGASTNNGLGMWTQELSAGTTQYFNDAQSIHFAVTAYYDINGVKKDTTYTQSNPFTLQGGLGFNYKPKSKWMGWAGVVGYAQWMLTPSTFVASVGPVQTTLEGSKGHSYGIGPEVTTLQGALTLRYLWQFGVSSGLQGGIFFAQFAMPI